MRAFLIASSAAVAAIVLGDSGLVQAQARTVVRALEYGISEDGAKFALTDEQRVILRRYLLASIQARATTGSASGTTVLPGDRVPDSVALRPFPAAVYREAPRLGAYRYIQVGPRAYVVDPRQRTVIEEFDWRFGGLDYE